MVYTQPMVGPTAADVRPDAIQRCSEYAAVWPWAACAILAADTPRGGLRPCGGDHRALDAIRVSLWAEFRPGPVLPAAVYHGPYLAPRTDVPADGTELLPDRDCSCDPASAGSSWTHPA